MKTPTDVYNHLQVALAHIEDIKTAKGITVEAPEPEQRFGIKPNDVLNEAISMLEVLKEIAEITKTGDVNIPETPQNGVTPREIFAAVNNAVLVLSRIKRRIGAPDRSIFTKATLRISPSHVFEKAVRVRQELKILQHELR